MSTLYIRLPSKAVAEAVEHWLALPCPYALASGDAVEREGVASLNELAATVAAAQRVVLLLAAADVTLLRVKTPPLSAAKLKLALPNLVEDQLVTDAGECVLAAGDMLDGLRTVAVAQRGWLDILAKTLAGLGARQLVAVPAQLCLGQQAARATAATMEYGGTDIELTLRLDASQGMGLTLAAETGASGAPGEVLAALAALVPAMPLTLYVGQARVAAYHDVLRTAGGVREINVFADNWSLWIPASGKLAPNLLAGMTIHDGAQAQWRQWRWPAGLAAAVLAVNALGLNLDWWRLKHEASTLRTGMVSTYKATYPKETVILDALAQMQKKVAAAEHNAGRAQPDDFGPLAANFDAALNEQMRTQNMTTAAPIASLEYRERALLVRLKPEVQLSAEQMKPALAARNLSLNLANGAWQIRSVQ
ncbi:MAG: general secretion pathway protein GspL [Burkholderiaceae bacterium]|nr:general secretion pathway protein GspL [Burkholderiaceae bacterium]